MDDARLEPQTGAALHAAALTKDLEAPLKRDMAICIYINISHTHNGQLNVPLLPNAKAGESENQRLACPVLTSWLKWSSFFPRHRNALARQPSCISTASSRVPELLLRSSLHN
jgi:hypothetical protein